MKLFILLLSCLFTTFSFAQDYKIAASEYCNCFKTLKDSMDTKFKEMLIKASKDNDMNKSLQSKIDSLTSEEKQKFSKQMDVIGDAILSEQTVTGRCGIALDNKYGKFTDTPEKEKTFYKNLLTELEKIPSCALIAAAGRLAFLITE